MKRKIKNTEENRSIKTLVFYGVIVLSVIFIALLLRVFSIIRESKFDGEHRFLLAVGKEERVSGLVSFEPVTSSLSLLTFSKDSSVSFSMLNKKIGIIPDGYIKTKNDVSWDAIASVFQTFLFNWSTLSKNITYYDLLRLWVYANKTSGSGMTSQQLDTDLEVEVIDKIVSDLFNDNLISSENVSIQIMNAAGESGLGSRLERVITNMGGNVVSVETALKPEHVSKILYSDADTYTFRKLKSLLPYREELLRRRTIADIVIILGEDNKNTNLY